MLPRPAALFDHLGRKGRDLCRAFRRDSRGNVAMLFGLSVVPIMGLIGVTADYAGAASLRQRIQAAADVTALAYARQASTMTNAALVAAANTYVQNQLTPAIVTNAAVTVTAATLSADGKTLTITVTARYKPAFLGSLSKIGFGSSTVSLSTRSVTTLANQTTEVALVIDNSGSMAESAGGVSKMQAAITQAQSLVTTLIGTSAVVGNPVKISLVPFTLGVNVGSGYASANWMDTQGKSSIHWQHFDMANTKLSPKPVSRFDLFGSGYLGVNWAGCVETRPGSYALDDTGASTTTPDTMFVPMLAPDEPGAGTTSASYGTSSYNQATNYNWYYGYYGGPTYYYPNSYLNDNGSGGVCSASETTTQMDDVNTIQNKVCKYKNASPSTTALSQNWHGPNFLCTGRPLMRLSGDPVALATQIGLMSANGSTNLLEGFTWGWRTLSPNTPFADGQAYSTAGNKKIIVMLTDGTNSWNAESNPNGSDYSPAGYVSDDRFGVGATTSTGGRTVLDNATLSACGKAKAVPNNIEIYTIAFSVPSDPIDATGQNLLTSCASLPTASHAFVATDSASLTAVFQAIKDSIGQLRVSQ